MAKFAYNNTQNASIGHTLFELNCGYHLPISFKEDIHTRSWSESANKLSDELRELMIVCRENLYYAQELQKQAQNKDIKSWSYAFNNKVWLNSKYIKTKQNWKLETKFFRLFQVLYLVTKQAYKLELSRKFKIHDIIYMLLLQ